MKVAVTGASGLLGRAVVKEFRKRSCEVLGLAFSRIDGDLVRLDLRDANKVQRVIGAFQPDVIVHCAAQTNIAIVHREYEASRVLNVTCSRTLAALAGSMNATFIYISTDQVFDGSNPPYAETDEPHPVNRYGATKLEGEREVMRVNPDSIILRCPVLYGGENFIEESDISRLIRSVRGYQPFNVSQYEMCYPAHTSDIGKICVRLSLMKLRDPALNSIFHWSGFEPFTKYQMVKAISETFFRPSGHLTASDYPGLPLGLRIPKNPHLSCQRLDDMNIGCHTVFRSGIRRDYEKFMDENYLGGHELASDD